MLDLLFDTINLSAKMVVEMDRSGACITLNALPPSTPLLQAHCMPGSDHMPCTKLRMHGTLVDVDLPDALLRMPLPFPFGDLLCSTPVYWTWDHVATLTTEELDSMLISLSQSQNVPNIKEESKSRILTDGGIMQPEKQVAEEEESDGDESVLNFEKDDFYDSEDADSTSSILESVDSSQMDEDNCDEIDDVEDSSEGSDLEEVRVL
tara:strand:- start:2114 stop:2734 length:621 start_codon:yes stop_codon:yes gene_type:complete